MRVVEKLYHGLSACTRDDLLPKVVDYLLVRADKPWHLVIFRPGSIELLENSLTYEGVQWRKITE